MNERKEINRIKKNEKREIKRHKIERKVRLNIGQRSPFKNWKEKFIQKLEKKSPQKKKKLTNSR